MVGDGADARRWRAAPNSPAAAVRTRGRASDVTSRRTNRDSIGALRTEENGRERFETMAAAAAGVELGRLRSRRSARAAQSDHAGEGTAAALEVREGRSFCLSLPLDRPGGNYHDLQRRAPRLQPMVRNGRVKYNLHANADHPDVFSDDAVLLYSQFSTHWDALAHVGSMFDADGDGGRGSALLQRLSRGRRDRGRRAGGGGRRSRDVLPVPTALGIERMAEAGVQGRGVLVDLRRAFGDARRAVGYDDLMRTMRCAERGRRERGHPVPAHRPNRGAARARRAAGGALRSTICSVISTGATNACCSGSTTAAWRRLPRTTSPSKPCRRRAARPGRAYERLHELCLFKLGIRAGELWYPGRTRPVARRPTNARASC